MQVASWLKKNKSNVIPVVIVVSGAILFWLGWLGARGGNIIGIELNVFRFFNNAPDAVVVVFMFITFFGTLAAMLAVCAALMILKRTHLAMQVLMAGSLAWSVANVLKFISIRQRPYELLSNVNLAENHDLTRGFPSAHSALIAAVVTILLLNSCKKIYWLLILAVILVGVSRLVVGMHAPLDVIGGVGIGLFFGGLIKLIFIKVAKQKTAR